MICYRDMMFCSTSFETGCGNNDCGRNYDDAERKRNTDGVDLPVSVGDCKSDDCGFKEPKT